MPLLPTFASMVFGLSKPTTRAALAGLGLLSVLGLAEPARAMTSLLGGRTLGLREDQAARVEMGWPGIRLTYLLPFTEELDVSPQFGLVYGHNLRGGLVGYEPGVEVRWRLLDRGPWSLAFLSDPAVLLWIPTDGTDGQLALRAGPGLVAGFQAGRSIQVFSALRVPFRFAVTPSPTFAAPILADLGVEVEVFRSEDVNVQANGVFSLGPELCTGECRSVDLSARMALGASVMW